MKYWFCRRTAKALTLPTQLPNFTKWPVASADDKEGQVAGHAGTVRSEPKKMALHKAKHGQSGVKNTARQGCVSRKHKSRKSVTIYHGRRLFIPTLASSIDQSQIF
jgi:hypothetical protein